MRGRAGKAQSPRSERCSWCTATPTSTCYSSVGVGAGHPPQTPPRSQALSSSTYRLLGGSPHCNRKGSASAGRREGENGNSDRPPPKRGFPGRIACRASPGDGHCLLKDREVLRKRRSHQPRAWCPRHPTPRMPGHPALFTQHPPWSPMLPGPPRISCGFYKVTSGQFMDPCQRPRGTQHPWTLRDVPHRAAYGSDPVPARLSGCEAALVHAGIPQTSAALAQESRSKCQVEAGPETTSVRTSQQIKAEMLLPQPSVPVESLRKRAAGQGACKQAFAVLRRAV